MRTTIAWKKDGIKGMRSQGTFVHYIILEVPSNNHDA
jgi:hypothetical protein